MFRNEVEQVSTWTEIQHTVDMVVSLDVVNGCDYERMGD